tara:strand:- start:472 stop:756 length:285 start_codon:yes stop_codon:yes gene_type:complete
MNNNKPVLGFQSQRIIGYWDEGKNLFVPANEHIMKEEASLFMRGNDIYPFAVKITDTLIEGNYLTYRGIGAKLEDPRTIVYVTQDENKELIQQK